MGLIDTVAERFGYVKAKPRGNRGQVLAFTAQHGQWNMPGYDKTENQLRAFQQFSWIMFCVSRISESCAGVPLKVLEYDGEETTEIANHPFEQLLRRPNPYMSRNFVLQHLFASAEITGNGYWYIPRNGMGEPAEIWPLRPDWVTPVPDPKDYLKGYVYRVDEREIPLEADEVLHVRSYHPQSDYVGLSAIEALAYQLEGDQAAVRWNTNFFGRDKAVPAGIVNIKEFVDDPTYERIKQEWRDTYGGTDRKTAIIRGGAIEWQDIQPSQSDMQFLELRQWTKEEIWQTFGIPPGLFDKSATEANSKTAERTWINTTLWPKLVRVAEQATLDVVQPFYGEQYVAEFEDVRVSDRALEIEELKVVTTGNLGEPIMTTDEIRGRWWNLGALADAMVTMEPLPEDEDEGPAMAP